MLPSPVVHRGHRTGKGLMGTPLKRQLTDNQSQNKTTPWPSDGERADGHDIQKTTD